ncbi:MAG: hypothetical protein DHS20C21_14300 [Gemmatimonadota bacterium]|nr:MAG: hypothetical protein DHS20C21_14300 [Gemmatimonadota bacterium]
MAGCSDPGKELDVAPPDDDGGDPGGEPAAPDTVTYSADRDNTLYEHPGGVLSNGAGSFIFAGKSAGDQVRRALLRFDLSGTTRGDAVVQAAWLDLECSRARNVQPLDVALHRVTASWGEAGSDGKLEEGQGAVAEAGDATWIHREFDALPWTAEGGDFDPTASAAVPVAGLGAYRWSSTSGLVADVQGWVEDAATNHGWIVLGDESSPETAKRFNSREHAAAASQPRLTVVFAPPPVAR